MEKRYPFPFLNAYQREDSDFFFGRDEEIETLYQMTQQASIALVYGTSGTGKTSLIRCGLSKKFKSYDWLELYVRRGKHLVASTDKLLCEASGGLFSYSDAAIPQNRIESLSQKIEAVYRASFKPLYLVFDQFEELFILGDKNEENAFTMLLQDILSLDQPVKAIISIREEYLGYLFDMERQIPELLRKKLRVEPMGMDKTVRVLTGVDNTPNSLVHLQEGETEAIAKEIFYIIKGEETRRDIDLPYLQVFLDRFYAYITGDEGRSSACTFSLFSLRELPEFGDVLREFLDAQVLQTAVILNQDPEQLWQILSAFVTLDGTKEPLTQGELENRRPEKDPSLLQAVVQSLVSRRILRFDEKDHRYEVAHDSLARQIHGKRSDEEIALLEVQRLIKSQAALNPEAREFFSEKQLHLIESYLPRFRPSSEESDWIERSRAHHQAEKEAAARKAREELDRALQQAEQERSLKEAAVKAQNEAESARTEAEKQKTAAESNALRARQRTRLAIAFTVLAFLLATTAVVLALESQRQKREIQAKRNEVEQALNQFKREQAEKTMLQFKNLKDRANTILNEGGCPEKIFREMYESAKIHPDSLMIRQQIDSLKQKFAANCL
jgi:hypothetical protein